MINDNLQCHTAVVAFVVLFFVFPNQTHVFCGKCIFNWNEWNCIKVCSHCVTCCVWCPSNGRVEFVEKIDKSIIAFDIDSINFLTHTSKRVCGQCRVYRASYQYHIENTTLFTNLWRRDFNDWTRSNSLIRFFWVFRFLSRIKWNFSSPTRWFRFHSASTENVEKNIKMYISFVYLLHKTGNEWKNQFLFIDLEEQTRLGLGNESFNACRATTSSCCWWFFFGQETSSDLEHNRAHYIQHEREFAYSYIYFLFIVVLVCVSISHFQCDSFA